MPVTIPFAFGTRTGNVPASNLDDDFQTLASFANSLETEVTVLQGQIVTVLPPFNLSGLGLGAPTILDLQGTSRGEGTNKNGLRWEVAIGTDAMPITAAGSAVKMSLTRSITTDPPAGCANGIDPACGSVLTVAGKSLATSTMMGVGLFVETVGDQVGGATGGSKDQIAVYGLALRTGGSGDSYGGYFEGRKNTGATGGLVGAEITQRNHTATDCVHNAQGGNCRSAWLTGLGDPGLMGVGIALRDSGAGGAGKFQAGFQCTDYSVGDHGGGCFEDYSSATRSIKVAGTHLFGLDTTAATFAGPAVLLADGQLIGWGAVPLPINLYADSSTGILRLGRTGGASMQFATPLTLAAMGAAGPGTDGILTYCSDCSATSPCTGAGAGRFARGEGAAWNCS